MNRIRIAPIVEGHGENEAIRILLQRTWELLGGEFASILKPIRSQRQLLVRKGELERAIDLAVLKLQVPDEFNDPPLVLVLLDADDDRACVLGPELLNRAKSSRGDNDITCIIANPDYESWFVAAAESLSAAGFLNLHGESVPERSDEAQLGKGWIKKRFCGPKYSETVDQPRMTAKMDLASCRRRSASFDKLCRELEIRLRRG